MDIFLDSGAFSVKETGNPINIQEYIAYIKKHEKEVKVYANLDVIGDPVATWENQKIMEDAGLRPLPVYHPRSDPLKYLHKCLDNYDYFAVGGIAHKGVCGAIRREILDGVWNILTDEKGMPRAKIHGFGVTDTVLLHRYCWFSVDSSSWVYRGRYGMIVVPQIRNGKYCFFDSPIEVFVSTVSPRRFYPNEKHIDTLSPKKKEMVLDYLAFREIPLGKVETDKSTGEEIILEEGIINDNFWRDFCNFCFYQDTAISIPEWPWAWNKKSQHRVSLI